MKPTSRRLFAASLLAIAGAIAAAPARARTWYGGGGDSGRGGDGHDGNHGGGNHGGAGPAPQGDRGQSFHGGRPAPQGGHGQPGPQPHFERHSVQGFHAPPQGGAQPHFDAGRWRDRDRQAGGDDRGQRDFHGADANRSGDNGRWNGHGDGGRRDGGARDYNRREAFGGGRRDSGRDSRGRGDWVRRYGGDHRWGRGDWDSGAVRRISAGRYFGRSDVDICQRYFGRRCVRFSDGWYGPWRWPWRVGYILPGYVDYWPVPYDLYYDLPPCPYGYDYCQVEGGDILVISLLTGLVVDAILFL